MSRLIKKLHPNDNIPFNGNDVNDGGNESEYDTDYTSTDYTSDAMSEDPPSDTELSEENREQFTELMTQYKKYNDKMSEINQAKKLIGGKIKEISDELKHLMDSNKLNEVIFGNNKFVIEQYESSNKISQESLRTIAEVVIGDIEKVDKLFSMADEMKKKKNTTRLKFVKA